MENLDERERRLTARERAADLREAQAEARERLADQREREADARECRADRRDRAADARDQLADQREQSADRRDQLADEREQLADRREREADTREAAANHRERLLDADADRDDERTTDPITRFRGSLARTSARTDRSNELLHRSREAVRRGADRMERIRRGSATGPAASEHDSDGA
ncbi:hypothetical protein [Couchioplanes azureus]|uniref:hypothetical protein n=1 Tax=Couchioplanes caeruleus TaxID=56438 RepID=UPI00166F9545|nr:hypothetical protein [Couchioplanes caeruleus]